MSIPLAPDQLLTAESLARAYDGLRLAGGAHRTGLGIWLSSYADCRAVLGGDAFSSDVFAHAAGTSSSGNLLFMDPPEHTRRRKAVVNALPPGGDPFREFVGESCDRVLGELCERSTIDVVTDLAQPMAAVATAHILGLRGADLTRLSSSVNAIRALMDPLAEGRSRAEARASSLRLMRRFARTYTDPAELVPGGMLSILAGEDPDPAGAFLFSATAVMLTHASYENTANFIAGAILFALRNDDVRGRLIDTDSNIELLEELFRLHTSAHTVVRRARTDAHIGGMDIPSGQLIFVMLAAANRDPHRFGAPAEVAAGRRRPHLTFGHGRHACLGAGFARDEARITLERFFRRFPRCSLAAPEDWRPSITMRGLRSLEVGTGR